jgi:uncharacterized protein YndB with AHSA1/START domain
MRTAREFETMQRVEVHQTVPAPIDVVWDRYTDHRSWTRWAGMGTVTLDREGRPPPNGVGCVRVISNAGLAVFEEILEFEAPRRMSYRVVKGGIPIRDHLGEVLFEERGPETLVTWRCRFTSRVPGLGLPFRVLITSLFRRALRGLVRTGLR